MEIKQPKQIKIDKLNTKDNSNPIFDKQELFNQIYINDLTRVIKTNLTIPTHTPKKFIDCIYLYFDGSTTYELYLYINNTWKKVTLS